MLRDFDEGSARNVAADLCFAEPRGEAPESPEVDRLTGGNLVLDNPHQFFHDVQYHLFLDSALPGYLPGDFMFRQSFVFLGL